MKELFNLTKKLILELDDEIIIRNVDVFQPIVRERVFKKLVAVHTAIYTVIKALGYTDLEIHMATKRLSKTG